MATKNDYRRLKDEADIAAVIAYLNIPVKKMGYNYFIHTRITQTSTLPIAISVTVGIMSFVPLVVNP
jgi:hypothetical protein